ncbi:hypothetical protein [Shouchella clausii]|jgi:hypothetical protein|uniref:hypothetical protein n=1 Tax=Shouchella clausii TaxID=79880 RepID=UPI000B967DAB|nr:hypothetical protein [Shouchella clausii]AST95149.1 hypothetical protein BC8716_03785 [Shouchella clausii]MCM3549531.1 hypothetical protein [Shouchella clausii]MEB5474653.1 hypothetical protein [Shouchella clausii]PAE99076.1 hypothetical protein CHH71_01315 [Shouchella clausii]PTL24202.1 hypothetical protein DA802_03800 [Shouchella clausii]
MSSKSLCVTTYVFGNYKRYIPYFVYSVLKSYPDYFVKVFSYDNLSTKETDSLERIKQHLSSSFEIKENYYTDKISKASEGKARRFLLPHAEFKGFKYAYIGDIDFLIVKEEPSLLDSHIKHCQDIGLPYSNQIRPQSRRLTGLHFFKVKEYFEKMEPVINEYIDAPEKIEAAFRTGIRNEEFLYNLIEQTIGFGKMNDHHYRPHHGFHLGILRSGVDSFKSYVDNGHKNKFHQLPKYAVLKKALLRYYNDPLFKELERINPIKEVQILKKLLRQH